MGSGTWVESFALNQSIIYFIVCLISWTGFNFTHVFRIWKWLYSYMDLYRKSFFFL